jgi:hypothetical protein
MKKLILVAAFLTSVSAFAADYESVAIERLSYELTKAPDLSAKVNSLIAYFDSLNRLGVAPQSANGCLNSALKNGSLDGCLSVKALARTAGGAGTGGAD